ncbi:hypothetical protein ACQE30_10655 [Staphylococcus cohnii]|uniref:Gram-positive cocci surface proteins LPxTG domain-containing protein n=1 Tax=Staphylococcus cohnii TaxID=29382 RepID=A0ABT6J164_9STAP|nr:hypothetical protein [Staphylococcus cohnii]MCI2940514.1 hypothetical protein [Staphylococcus cohnii]MDH5140244.1 hypothetical protein [Staphylococcus cohnii]MDH5158260.1 hypothetical protein [Staphylococcus cohnii]MDH5169801.1 hypothetical protein [Staphylococcus cohnii]OAO10669.1 hypothetical protein A4A82_05845 [Staphylococcus cohnii]
MKKVLLSTALLMSVVQFSSQGANGEEIPHGILHKDGSFTEPNVFPHKDIAEVEEPKELEDATNEFNHKSNSETSLHNNAVNEKLKDEGGLNPKNPGAESKRFNKNQQLDASKNSVKHNAIKELPDTGMISDNRTLTIFLASISLIAGSLLLCKRVNFKVFQK